MYLLVSLLSQTALTDVSNSNPLPHDMDHSSSLPCLSVTSHSNSEKKPSSHHHLPSIHLITQTQYTYTVVSELLTCTPLRNNFTKFQSLIGPTSRCCRAMSFLKALEDNVSLPFPAFTGHPHSLHVLPPSDIFRASNVASL